MRWQGKQVIVLSDKSAWRQLHNFRAAVENFLLFFFPTNYSSTVGRNKNEVPATWKKIIGASQSIYFLTPLFKVLKYTLHWRILKGLMLGQNFLFCFWLIYFAWCNRALEILSITLWDSRSKVCWWWDVAFSKSLDFCLFRSS